MEKLKVLIVDDEPIVSDFIKIRLATEAPHFSISQVESGYDCLDYLKENQADCILSDYQMPGMDGMELLKRLRSVGDNIPFIFITGQGNEEVASEAFKNGASDYFTKDVGFAHFPRIVNSVERAVRDLREQENREKYGQRLRESEEKYKLLFENNPNPMLVYDTDTLEILAVNNSAVSHYGYSRDEFLAISVKDIRPPEDYVEFLKTIEQIKKDGEKFRESGTWRHRKKNGDIIDVQISSHGINFEGRDARVVLVDDITEQKKVEDERSAMFHMLTHDIRGPLSVIYGYGSLASQMKGEEAAAAMEDVRKAAKRIYAIIDNILSLSRLESKEGGLLLQSTSLPGLIAQAVRENEAAAAEKGIAISVNADSGLPKIYCDSAQLGRAVSNLLSNAINYNCEGGRVDVRSGIAGKREVFIEVSDNGSGIDEEDLPRIFDKYYRGKESRKKKGTGLGLAIVKAVVEGHGGRVEVRTVKGEGATFRLVLPVKPGL